MDGSQTDPLVLPVGDPDQTLRAWLAALPPDAPPTGFYERIDAALGLVPTGGQRARRERPRGRVRNAARATSWLIRGPARGAAAAAGLTGLRAGWRGFGAARWALGPLGRPSPRRPLWQRVLGLGG